jgi:DNA-directed RNA polymerase specialized sigma24 family protein
MFENVNTTDNPSVDAAYATLIEYYPKLLSLSKHFVYKYRIPCWFGQEEDIAKDVAQETMRRMLGRIHKIVQGQAEPIHSIERMLAVSARNCVRDLKRHDRRMVRLPESSEHRLENNINGLEDSLETATEHIYHEWVFMQLAHKIIQLPCKQRKAILTDLANRMSFNEQLTPLQAAFLKVGIDIEEYQQPLPVCPKERARHAALLSIAYKRIAQLKYDEVDLS